MKRNLSSVISKMVVVAVLSALGIGLMQIKIPYFIPWINIDPSDTVILVSYAITGFWGSLSVALIKALIDFFISGTGIYGIGQISAFIASMSYVGGLFLFSHVLKMFRKGLVRRIVSYVMISLIVAVIMTAANAIFITPTYINGAGWDSCFNSDTVNMIVQFFGQYGNSYFIIIFVIYFPFNLIKGAFVCALYELLFNRVIFVTFKDNEIIKKYFSRNKSKETNGSIEDNK